MPAALRSVAVASVLLLGACKDKQAAAPAPAPVPASPSRPPGDPEPPPTDEGQGVPGSTNLAGLRALMPMLQQEAANRPKVTVPVEKLFAELAKAGIDTSSAKQVLGRSANAGYCQGLKITPGGTTVAIVVCEYATPELAEAARKTLDEKKPFPGAVRAVNGGTLVTVVNAGSQQELQTRVFDIFKAL